MDIHSVLRKVLLCIELLSYVIDENVFVCVKYSACEVCEKLFQIAGGLRLRAADSDRCAGEGEALCGLAKHAPMVGQARRKCQHRRFARRASEGRGVERRGGALGQHRGIP
jgi:hypothetical protein